MTFRHLNDLTVSCSDVILCLWCKDCVGNRDETHQQCRETMRGSGNCSQNDDDEGSTEQKRGQDRPVTAFRRKGEALQLVFSETTLAFAMYYAIPSIAVNYSKQWSGYFTNAVI